MVAAPAVQPHPLDLGPTSATAGEEPGPQPRPSDIKPWLWLDVPAHLCCFIGMIRFLVLGSGAAVPSPGFGQPAYWVEVDGRSCLLDPGPGALVRLIDSSRAPDSVDGIETVLLTHFHLDHCADLAPLLFALHSPVPEQTLPLHLIGPSGLVSHLEKLRNLYGDWLTPHRRELVVLEIEPGQTLVPAADPDWGWIGDQAAVGPRVEVFAAEHPQQRQARHSLCFRFEDREGHSAVFSGDTEPCAGLSAASRGADLLVVECSTPDALAMSGHMSPDRVGRLCADTRPSRVVLTHLYPPTVALDLADLVGRHYSGPVTVARNGDCFALPEPAAPSKEQA